MKKDRLILTLAIIAVLVVASVAIVLITINGDTHPSLEAPPGWESNSNRELKEWTENLSEEGYKEKAEFGYHSPYGSRNYGMRNIGMTYQPASASVLNALPDTNNVEEIEEYIQENETELREYIDTRYSKQVEAEALALDCGQAVLALKIRPEEKGFMELLVFKSKTNVYIVYINLLEESSVDSVPEEERYVIENLKVE